MNWTGVYYPSPMSYTWWARRILLDESLPRRNKSQRLSDGVGVQLRKTG